MKIRKYWIAFAMIWLVAMIYAAVLTYIGGEAGVAAGWILIILSFPLGDALLIVGIIFSKIIEGLFGVDRMEIILSIIFPLVFIVGISQWVLLYRWTRKKWQ